ncbi:MAG: PfkB family carbohydrate kinase [Halanaeroarchaeum sp.]
MHDIRDRLADGDDPTITVLPDGSIDRRFEIVDADGRALTREALSREILEDAKTLMTRPLGEKPGGQSVNAARQLHELGADTTLVGHLDDPIFASLPFDRYSMGDPAEILVYELADGVLMFAAESEDIQAWTIERFRSTVGSAAEPLLTADAVLWTNWSAFPHATEGLLAVEDVVDDGNVLVLDPGAVATRPTDDRIALLDTLGSMEPSFDVVLSPNRREANHVVEAIGEPTTDRVHVAETIRERADIEAVVVHDLPSAAVATSGRTFEVPTIERVVPSRHTGGGDRFSAGIVFGLAAGWSWEETVTLGNACATYYLQSGASGGPADLAALFEPED